MVLLGLGLLAMLHSAPQTTPQAVNSFAFRLIEKTGTPTGDENLLISPFSVSSALSMLVPGTSGEEQRKLMSVLAPGLSAEALRSGVKNLRNSMLSAGGDPLQIANSAWVYKRMPLNPGYVSELKDFYGSEVRPFERNTRSVQEINAWVDAKTKQRIPRIIESIEPDERLFLVNAIAFDGTWTTQFDPAQTRSEPFHRPSGDVSVPTMRARRSVPYFQTDELRAIRLDYEGGQFGMLLMLPEQGRDAGALLKGLSPEKLNAVLEGLGDADNLPIALPKFKFEESYNLEAPLSGMGLESLFKLADLSRISPELATGAISRVLHKTFIEVDEKGTKAAAATAVAVATRVILRDRPEFMADRPFAFLLLHKPTGTILFTGVVNDPVAHE